jgi:hypothetical protein
MIPVTNEPMECEVFDVQDHARRTGTSCTGTHGEMISSNLHGAEAVLPEAGASEASFSKNPRKQSVREASVIYTYNFLYILHLYSKKYVERQISCRIYENMHICTSI